MTLGSIYTCLQTIYLSISTICSACRPLSGCDYILGRTMLQLAELGVWVRTMLTRFKERQKCAGHRQKMCRDSFTCHVRKANNQHLNRFGKPYRPVILKTRSNLIKLLRSIPKKRENIRLLVIPGEIRIFMGSVRKSYLCSC